MNDQNPIVECIGLSKTYKGLSKNKVTALDDINLSIKKGIIFGIIGPNGSGKTTLFKILMGFIKKFSGKFIINGSENGSDIGIRETIGFLSEKSSFYPSLNSFQTLRYCGSFFKDKKIASRENISRLLEKVGLTQHHKKRVDEYSKGMLQRLAIAQAIINDPELLILDEPNSGLDPYASDDIKNIMRQLKEEGKTIILSSHVIEQVQDICDEIAIFYNGRLLKTGLVTELTRVSGKGMAVFSTKDKRIEEWMDIFLKSGVELESISSLTHSLEETFKEIVDKEKVR
jgi:ABC-2 type transport system ATP-binding protein